MILALLVQVLRIFEFGGHHQYRFQLKYTCFPIFAFCSDFSADEKKEEKNQQKQTNNMYFFAFKKTDSLSLCMCMIPEIDRTLTRYNS
jgi:hypothetical protein